jgi:hypothetical protein
VKGTKTLVLLIVIIAFVFAGFVSTAKAAQYGTDFKYSSLASMKDDGWTLTREAGISLSAGGGIVLDGNGGVCSIGYFYDVPVGIYDWTVEVKATWLGGSGHSWIDMSMYTERHSYTWAVDGSSGEYVFIRDSQKMPTNASELFGTPAYQEKANQVVQLDMQKHGSVIIFYFNSHQIRTYVEPDTRLSEVTGFALASPSNSAAKYIFAGADIPQPSGEGPVDINPVSDSDPPIVVTDPNPQSPTAPISAPPPLPYSSPPAPSDPPAPNYPTGPVTTQNPPPENPPTKLNIIVNPGTFSVNTGPTEQNIGAQAEAEQYIFDGVPQARISDPESIALSQAELHLGSSGQCSPETQLTDLGLFGGHSVGYYVTVNTHVSGDLTNPNTAASAVAIVTAQITDANGNILYQNTITATSSQGLTLDQLHMQAGAGIATFFQGVANQNK